MGNTSKPAEWMLLSSLGTFESIYSATCKFPCAHTVPWGYLFPELIMHVHSSLSFYSNHFSRCHNVSSNMRTIQWQLLSEIIILLFQLLCCCNSINLRTNSVNLNWTRIDYAISLLQKPVWGAPVISLIDRQVPLSRRRPTVGSTVRKPCTELSVSSISLQLLPMLPGGVESLNFQFSLNYQ